MMPLLSFDRLASFFPPDPGALRLLAALRATLAGAITFFLILALGAVIQVQVADRILGFAMALFIAATVRDSTPHQRLMTIALAPLAAFAATAAAAGLQHHDLLAAGIVPLIMFAVSYGASRGPRYASLGMVAVIAYMVGLVSGQPPATLPLRLCVLLLAAADAALVRQVLLPERPLTELARLRRAIHAGVNRVLACIAAAVARGSWTDAARTGLHRDVYRLGEVIMLAQARIAALAARLPDQGSHWMHLLTIELATERTARVALRYLGTPAERPLLLASLTALRNGVSQPAAPAPPPLGTTLTLLDHVLREPLRADLTPVAPPAAVTGAPALRIALQTAIAAALAITGGELVSPNRWYWAAFAAFVMFQGTRSRGESLAKGVQFMVGTLAGVVAGMLLATLLSGHELLTMATVVVAVFLAFQANVAAYGMMIFWITIILGLVFGMLGYFTPDLLLLRLKEAAVGAACGALVTSFVLVRRDVAAIQDAIAGFLRTLAELVDSAVHSLLDGRPEATLAARILIAEQRFHDLGAVARPRQSGLGGSRDEQMRRRMILFEACDQWARELGQLALRSVKVEDPALIRSAHEAAARIAATVPDLLTRVADQSSVDRITDEPTEDLGAVMRDDPPHRAIRLLLRIDAALVHLALRAGSTN